MRGVVKCQRGSGFVELRQVDELPPGPAQVKVEVQAAGICGSDLHIYHDTINYNIRTPVVMGHEFSGVVVDKGSQVGDEVSIGDRVTGEPSIEICGVCDYCRSGHYNMCPTRTVMGYYHDGCFAPFVNATLVHRLPDRISFEAGAVTELLACCVHSVIEQAGVTAGDLVAVIGPGPVGLFSALVARAEGGTVVLCGTGRDAQRLRFAEAELGIADVVVECAGAAAAIDLALEVVRKRGKVSLMGLPGRRVEADLEKIAYKELRVSGGIGQRRTAWERALRLMDSGLIDNEKLISHQLGLAQWQRGFEMMERQEGLKLLLRPTP
jgi:L-iditol 2-dehydrogenase